MSVFQNQRCHIHCMMMPGMIPVSNAVPLEGLKVIGIQCLFSVLPLTYFPKFSKSFDEMQLHVEETLFLSCLTISPCSLINKSENSIIACWPPNLSRFSFFFFYTITVLSPVTNNSTYLWNVATVFLKIHHFFSLFFPCPNYFEMFCRHNIQNFCIYPKRLWILSFWKLLFLSLWWLSLNRV